MTAAVALVTIIGLSLRQIRRARRTLDLILANGTDGCDVSWCICDLGDSPCASTIRYGGGFVCEKTTGHAGMHASGGWAWSDGFAQEQAA